MYEFHYKYIEQKYDNSAKFLFTDWDSLVYEIETWCMKIFIKKKNCLSMKLRHDVYKDFYKNKNLFDFSCYLEDSNIFDLVNKKVIG